MQDTLEQLRENLLYSYIRVSKGIGIIAVLFPVAVYLDGFAFGISLQDSLSHYFFAIAKGFGDPFDHPARVLFVGGLFGIGTFLFLYKGFTRGENIILNFAGLFAIGVAVLPMGMFGYRYFTPHASCAVALFLCMIYIAIWGKRTSLKLMKNLARKARYEKGYNVIAGLMASFIVIAFAMNGLLGAGWRTVIFFVESVGVWIFAAYWVLKSMELNALMKEHERLKP